jgi:hypothetical protein
MVWTVPEMAIDREDAVSKLTGAGLMARFPIEKSVHCGQAREQMVVAVVLDERASEEREQRQTSGKPAGSKASLQGASQR